MNSQGEKKAFNTGDFEDLAKEWLLYKSYLVKDSTYNKYKFLLKKYIMPEFESIRVSDISTSLINKKMLRIYEKSKNNLSDTSFKSVFFILKAIILYGVKLEYFPPVHFTFKISGGSSQKEVNVLDKIQEKKIVTELTKEKNANNLGILLSLYTGMRLGEICALTINDINLENHTIAVSKTVQRLRGSKENATKLVISEPKSKKSNRVIPLPEFLYKIVLDYNIDLNKKERYLLSYDEKPYEPRTLQYAFERIVKKCDYEDLNFHCLRHTFATKCVAEGFDIKTLSEILGHSNVAFTMDRYVHSNLDLKKKQMDKLNDSWILLDI